MQYALAYQNGDPLLVTKEIAESAQQDIVTVSDSKPKGISKEAK
jgi:hypothetical protein